MLENTKQFTCLTASSQALEGRYCNYFKRENKLLQTWEQRQKCLRHVLKINWTNTSQGYGMYAYVAFFFFLQLKNWNTKVTKDYSLLPPSRAQSCGYPGTIFVLLLLTWKSEPSIFPIVLFLLCGRKCLTEINQEPAMKPGDVFLATRSGYKTMGCCSLA